MKRIMKCFITLVFVLILYIAPLICFAKKNTINSEPISTPEINIEEVIKELVTEELVKERFQMVTLFEPVDYYYNISNYLLEYNVSFGFWDNVFQFDYDGVISQIDYSYPTIYIPIFAQIEDVMQIKQERVIGNIILKYNLLKDQYEFGMMLYNRNSTDYLNKSFTGSYEKIQEYNISNEADIVQVFLIKFPSASSTDDERIAVVKTQSDTSILDVSNSLHINGENSNDQINVYTIEEYSIARKEVEKYLYQDIDISKNNPDDKFVKCIPYLLSGLVALGIVVILVLNRNKTKNLSKID